ncbi:MAG: hypothetical protein KC488_10325, partial [Candidatus Cloacimonetes bacterium]|nr:hypothetical protein [Candidatus Cloacimonadota bacterium]
AIFGSQPAAREQLRAWLARTDGDFIVFGMEKSTSRWFMFNDMLGRLPVYCTLADHRLALARDITFIARATNNSQMDRMALAQCLLFGYPLGNRTLLQNVFRLAPATLILIAESGIQIERLHDHDFDLCSHADRDLDSNASVLADLFVKACAARSRSMADSQQILSLSGGLDSRAVGSGLKMADCHFSSSTYLDAAKTGSCRDDVAVAFELVKVLDVDWNLTQLHPVAGQDVLRMLRLKSGMNFLGMSFILSFFDRIRERHGDDVVYHTGDGGDKLLPDLRPQARLNTPDDLVQYILAKQGIMSLEDAARLVKLDPAEILEDLTHLVMSYPEQSVAGKYVHFQLLERAFKWLFEGEDRNRCCFWSVSPFYSIHFFEYAMNCPAEQKAGFNLFKAFLSKLSPDVSRVANATWHMPITSKKLKRKLLQRRLYGDMPDWIRPLLRRITGKGMAPSLAGNRNRDSVSRCVTTQFDVCESLTAWFDRTEVDRMIAQGDRNALANIFTLTSAIEWFETGRSSISTDRTYECL